MGKLGSIFGLLALGVSIVSSDPATYTAKGGSNIQYAVGVPTSAASAGSGDIYLQLSAPTTYTWVAMGIGSGMTGATIFVMYTDGSGNVTISPRSGKGHVMPNFDSSIKVELLAGSGVSGNVMKANIKYTASSSVLKLASSSTNWIAAWKSGSGVGSTSQSATIQQHDSHDQFTFDLTKATISSDSNPFVAAAVSSSTTSGSATATKSESTSDPTATPTSGSGSSGSNSGSSTSPQSSPIAPYQTAHGILMAASFVVLLPSGAIFMNLFGGVWVHTAIQMFAFVAILAGFGVGLHLADVNGQLFKQDHTIFGLVIVILMLLQPFLGLLHHRQYKKLGQRSYFGHGHMWYGRLLIVLGVINGGLGLRLAGNSKNGEIAYGVVAGVLGLAYIAAVVLSPRNKGANGRNVIKHGSRGSNGYEMH